MQLTLAGLETSLPEEIDDFFDGDLAVSRNPHRRRQPHELDASYLYLGLRACEEREGLDLRPARERVVEAILKRRDAATSLWLHEHIPGPQPRHGLRATAAAIQLLTEARADGVVGDVSLVERSLRAHVHYGEYLAGGGFWFFHDTSEHATDEPREKIVIANRIWGSTPGNALVLNSHIDTVLTLLHFLSTVDDSGREDLHELLDDGLQALEKTLAPTDTLPLLPAAVERFVRRMTLRRMTRCEGARRSRFKRHRDLVRGRLLLRYPSFQRRDGFTERHLGWVRTSYPYHAINLRDFARLAARLHLEGRAPDLVERLGSMITSGLDYAFREPYRSYVMTRMPRPAAVMHLCDTLYLHALLGHPTDARWAERYASVRGSFPRTPMLAGYDPLVLGRTPSAGFQEKQRIECAHPTQDALLLGDRILLVDFEQKTCEALS